MMLNLIMTVILARGANAQSLEAIRLADYWAGVHGVEREMIHAVIEAESGWNPRAVLRIGSVGLMQLMPDTATAFGVANRFDMNENTRAGVEYLAKLLHRHSGDHRPALASYNAAADRKRAATLVLNAPADPTAVQTGAIMVRAARR